MGKGTESSKGWWARGLLFENCSCQIVCPGHVHFSQSCTEERCLGFWAIRFDEGSYDGHDLAGACAVITYDSPRNMIEGDWTEGIVIDESASPEVRQAVETILTGHAGGPWEILARFVGRRLPTRFLPVRIEDEERAKRVVVEGLLDGRIDAIRGRDRSQVVTLENMFNQIHAPSQVVARGSTRYDDDPIHIDNAGTHGLWSSFDWAVGSS